jgi:hypothetical protein
MGVSTGNGQERTQEIQELNSIMTAEMVKVIILYKQPREWEVLYERNFY